MVAIPRTLPMALSSRLLDAGREPMWVYPEEKKTDSRGNVLSFPSDTPVKIYATVSADRSSTNELPGQVSSDAVKVFTRSAPIGTWAKVVYGGWEWDLAAPPRFVKGMSKATEHVTFSLRSRNVHAADPSA